MAFFSAAYPFQFFSSFQVFYISLYCPSCKLKGRGNFCCGNCGVFSDQSYNFIFACFSAFCDIFCDTFICCRIFFKLPKGYFCYENILFLKEDVSCARIGFGVLLMNRHTIQKRIWSLIGRDAMHCVCTGHD